jgi:hypothetical protein
VSESHEGDHMSENYRFYASKVAQLRIDRKRCNEGHPLGGQLQELFGLVQKLEATWALEDRLGRKYSVRDEHMGTRDPKLGA